MPPRRGDAGPIRPVPSMIRIDKRVQARAKIVPKVVDDYAEAMRKGAEFPPLVVFPEATLYPCRWLHWLRRRGARWARWH